MGIFISPISAFQQCHCNANLNALATPSRACAMSHSATKNRAGEAGSVKAFWTGISLGTMLLRRPCRTRRRVLVATAAIGAAEIAARGSAAAATAATVAAAEAAATAAAAGPALLTGPRLVDGEGAVVVLSAVQGVDGTLRLLIALHFNEAEAARAAGFAVGDDLCARHLTVLAEHFQQVVGGGRPGQVADIDVLSHSRFLNLSVPQQPFAAEQGQPHAEAEMPRGS